MKIEQLAHDFLGPYCAIDIRENQPSSRLHTHNYDEIAIVLKGSGINVVDKNSYPVMRGDVFVIHGNQTHKIIKPKNLTLINIIYEKNRFEKIKEEIKDVPGFNALFVYEPIYRKHHDFKAKLHLSSRQIENIRNLLLEFKEEQDAQKPGVIYVVESIFKQLIVKLCRNYHQSDNPGTKGMLKISTTIDYMEKHFAENITIESLSDLVEMPKTTFRWTFKRITGSSPIDYLIHLRIGKAAEMMRGKPKQHVIDICLNVGFENTGYFGRKFKKIIGMTPIEYLRKQREDKNG